MPIEIGIDSFAAIIPDPATGILLAPADRLQNLLREVEIADQAGIDIFGVGEHHRPEFLDEAPAVILAAAAARTDRIRLTSAVTVLSAADPVRVFQDFATIDLISRGRAEIIAGRGSFGEAFPLFGVRTQDYDELYSEKLDLLIKLRDNTRVTWQGRFRAPLNGLDIYPRPFQEKMPIWLGAGGTPQSFARAGRLGLPLMVGIIGGGFEQFQPLVDLYRDAGRQAGHTPDRLKLGIHAFGFVADSDEAAKEAFFPGWAYLLGERGKQRGWSVATRARFEALCGPGGSYLIGSPDTVTKKLLAAANTFGNVGRFTFQMSCALLETQAMQRSIELLGGSVAPRLREALGE